MAHFFKSLKTSDGSWQDVKSSWKTQCVKFEEDFKTYARAEFYELDKYAEQSEVSYTVFGLIDDETHDCEAICSVNWTLIPGYTGKVLRVRNLLFAPRFDFGEFEVSAYGEILASVFARAYGLAIGDRPSQHIKFHLRSPVERQFFALAGANLDALDEFKAVKTRGAWLYVDLAQRETG